MLLISPWTEVLVHIVYVIREITVIVGLISVTMLFASFVAYCVCAGEKKDYGTMHTIWNYVIIFLFTTAVCGAIRLFVPPAEVVARIAIMRQLPEDADAEVVDELVRLVCKESARF